MKMAIDRTWLRDKILTDPDIECEAGMPAALSLLEQWGIFLSADGGQDNLELKMAFGTLVRQLRRRDNLSYEILAEKAQVEVQELRSIEHDAHYQPRPRTIHNLAKVFDLPPRELLKLSGAAKTVDTRFQSAALKFAAQSDDLTKLSDEEWSALNEYIKYLHETSQ